MKAEAGGGAQSADAHARKKEEDAMVGTASHRKCVYIRSGIEIMIQNCNVMILEATGTREQAGEDTV